MWHFTLLRFTRAIHYSLPFTFIFCSKRFYYARPLISFFFGPVYFFLLSAVLFLPLTRTHVGLACQQALNFIGGSRKVMPKRHVTEAVVRFLSPQKLHPIRKSD